MRIFKRGKDILQLIWLESLEEEYSLVNLEIDKLSNPTLKEIISMTKPREKRVTPYKSRPQIKPMENAIFFCCLAGLPFETC